MSGIDSEAYSLIIKAAQNGFPIAQLEYVGLPPRIVNVLEAVGILFLKDLIVKSNKEISKFPQMGKGGLESLLKSLSNFKDLDKRKQEVERLPGRLSEFTKVKVL